MLCLLYADDQTSAERRQPRRQATNARLVGAACPSSQGFLVNSIAFRQLARRRGSIVWRSATSETLLLSARVSQSYASTTAGVGLLSAAWRNLVHPAMTSRHSRMTSCGQSVLLAVLRNDNGQDHPTRPNSSLARRRSRNISMKRSAMVTSRSWRGQLERQHVRAAWPTWRGRPAYPQRIYIDH